MSAKRDGNGVTTALGIDGSTLTPFTVDPITGRLLVAIVLDGTFSVTDPEALPRDENRVTVAGAVDDSTGDIVPLYVDTDNGALQIDATFT